jgi:NADH dehydrogenase FAD-containing subunit
MLSAGEIAYPLRAVFKRDRTVRVLSAGVADFHPDTRELDLRSVGAMRTPERLGCDTLIVAGGANYSYIGKRDGVCTPAKSSRSKVRSRFAAR